MGNFKPNNRGGFKPRGDRNSSFGGRSEGRSSDRGGFRKPSYNNERTEKHDAVCAKCGKQCQVPFRPTGDKPVLCNDCFRAKSGSSNFNSGNRDRPQSRPQSFSQSSSGISQEQFKQLNTKLDKILAVLQDLEIADDEDEDEEDEEE